MFSRSKSHSHARLSLITVAHCIKFIYYPITHIIGRVTHPLASLSSTSSSVFILIVFIIIDTASISTALPFTKDTCSEGDPSMFLRAFDEEYKTTDGVKG